MCLVLLAHRVHPDYPLIIAANRDEFHARPAAPVRFWPDVPGVLAGRDLEADGTWIGVSGTGRFAAVTNFRETPPEIPPPRSRGALTAEYLAGETAPEPYLEHIFAHGNDYRAFSLLVGDRDTLGYYANRGGPPQTLAPGLHGLSNDFLNSHWPKVRHGKAALAPLARADSEPHTDALLALLADATPPPDDEISTQEADLETARRLAPRFIHGEVYGTRASTAIIMSRNGDVWLAEQRYGPNGTAEQRADFHFRIADAAQETADAIASR